MRSPGTASFVLANRFNGRLDDRDHWLRVRNVNGVTANGFDRGGVRSICHETLGIWWDHPVLRRDEVPTRLGPPRRLGDLACERFDAPRHLRVCHEGRKIWVDVA